MLPHDGANFVEPNSFEVKMWHGNEHETKGSQDFPPLGDDQAHQSKDCLEDNSLLQNKKGWNSPRTQ